MIQEAYVSFEVAKLLKEKGFNEPIRCWYDNFQDFHEEGVRMSNSDCLPPTIMCPTQAMAMAWFRKVHNISIEPFIDWGSGDEYWWTVDIGRIKKNGLIAELSGCESYEDAVEAALKYCLEII